MWESIFGSILVGFVKAIFARFQKDPASETIKETRNEAQEYAKPSTNYDDDVKRL